MSDSSNSDQEEFQIQKEPVHERDQIPSKLFGFTTGELGALVGAGMFGFLFLGGLIQTLAAIFAVYGYIRYLKNIIPENFIPNLVAYYRMDSYTFRSSGRDIEWRPPIVRHRGRDQTPRSTS